MMQRHIPMGYCMRDGKMGFDKEKVKIVQKIFMDYLSGITTHAIAKEMTAKGVLNANNKPSWNHGSIGRILENIKYLGDEMYPQMIAPKIFEQVQKLRIERAQKLGRAIQPNSMNNKNLFNSRLWCGECGEEYRKYAENCGKPSEKISWKCRHYIYKNRVHCICGVVTDEQIKEVFILAVNEIIKNTSLLEKKPKENPKRYSLEFLQIDQRIKELEEDEQFSSKELATLIFQRAEAFYKTAQIYDYDHNTEKMKNALSDKQLQTEFDEDLFSQIMKRMVIYADGRVDIEFINGLAIHENYKNPKKEVETYANRKREEHIRYTAASGR